MNNLQVEQVLQKVRPLIQQDGGDVELVEVKENKVYIRLTGACKGCPLSFFTLTMGIEENLKKEIPEIEEVIALED